MKRIITAWLILALALLACSCAPTEDKSMEQIWTQNQLNILNSTMIDPHRIEECNLLESELRLLDIVSRVDAYLAQRYPGHTFVLEGLKDVFFDSPTLAIYAADENGLSFSISTSAKEDDLSDLTITDGYYALIKAQEAGDYILTQLETLGLPGGKASMLLYGSFGEAYDPALTLAESIAQGLTFGISGDIFLAVENVSALDADAVAAALSSHGLHGYVYLWCMDALPEGDASAAWVKEYCTGITSIRIKIEQ